jgi:hypothetical protein
MTEKVLEEKKLRGYAGLESYRIFCKQLYFFYLSPLSYLLRDVAEEDSYKGFLRVCRKAEHRTEALEYLFQFQKFEEDDLKFIYTLFTDSNGIPYAEASYKNITIEETKNIIFCFYNYFLDFKLFF